MQKIEEEKTEQILTTEVPVNFVLSMMNELSKKPLSINKKKPQVPSPQLPKSISKNPLPESSTA